MSLLSKIKDAKNKRDEFISIGGPGGNDGATDPRNRLRPPDNRVMADQGIGGYLNPNQLEMFTNPPSPDNSAGQKNMADLLQQQADTFGGMLTYAPPPSDETPPDDGGGTDDGGGGGGITFPPDGPPFDDRFPPRDDRFPPRDDRFPPIDVPGLPPFVPPFDIPIKDPIDIPGATPQVIVYGPDGTMYPNPAAALAAGVTNYTFVPPDSGIGSLPVTPPMAPPPVTPPMKDVPPVVPPRDIPPPRPPFVPPRDEQIFVPPRDIPPIENRPPIEDRPPFIKNIPPPVAPPRISDGIGSISIDDLPRYDERVTLPSIDFLTGGLPSVNLPPSLPVPRMPTGMETLVSPEILMGRGRGRGRLS